jgi:hypothetical protein
MRRRSVLKFLSGGGVAGLVGCVAPSGGSPDEVGPERQVSITSQDAVSETHQLRIEASMVESMATKDHPAQVQVSLTNEGQTRWIQVGPRCPLFWKYNWASSPEGLLLPSSEEPRYVAESGPRWVLNPPEELTFGDGGCGRREYKTGESLRTEYTVYDDGRVDGYLEPGTYRFKDEFGLQPQGGDNSETSTPVGVPWKVSLTIATRE